MGLLLPKRVNIGVDHQVLLWVHGVDGKTLDRLAPKERALVCLSDNASMKSSAFLTWRFVDQQVDHRRTLWLTLREGIERLRFEA